MIKIIKMTNLSLKVFESNKCILREMIINLTFYNNKRANHLQAEIRNKVDTSNFI